MNHPQRRSPRAAAVPQGRAARLLHLTRAVGELAAGAAVEGVARLARGESAALSELMLTPGNARRLAQRLSTMRGAVMKVGQLMSMDGQGVLPREFAELLGSLRDRAHVMPSTQLADVLEREYGSGWSKRFRKLSFEPVAAASIGQVHRAETPDGRVLALKIQYPGVKRSIDSDVANLALLAKTPGLVPAAIDPAPLLERVRAQLHHETDYAAEARMLTAYRAALGNASDDALGGSPQLWVPPVHDDYCTPHILATEFAAGVPIDRLAVDAPQDLRDRVARALSRLAVREFFEMRLVQTDPNFGNYLYDAQQQRIVLLDFGATEPVTVERVEQLRELGRALRDRDRLRLERAAMVAGFIAAEDPPAQSAAVLDLMQVAGEPLAHRGVYDFGASDLAGRVFDLGEAQYRGDGYARTPPSDLLFLQRKFVGSFMLCVRLRARIDLAQVFAPHL